MERTLLLRNLKNNYMNIILIPTLSRFDLVDRLLISIYNQSVRPDRIIVIDNSNGKLLPIEGIEIHKANNIGVSGSWNFGLKSIQDNDLLFICNDDNFLEKTAIETISNLAKDNPEQAFFASAGGGFSFFAIKKTKMFYDIGYFDEGFYPAYFEDNDYHYRMKLKNYDFICSEQELYRLGVNGEGSQTINSNKTKEADRELIQLGYRVNQLRYVQKWGGGTNEEKFIKPFNL